MLTKTQGLTTSQAIDMGIRHAEIEGREIHHGVARAIADSFHDGSALTLSFVSTGTILGEDTSELWRALFPNYYALSRQEQNWANWLGTYLGNREDRGAIEGWANLWADRPE